MNEHITQLATIRVKCNDANGGSGILYFPSAKADVAYVFTAKHCLAGKHFEKSYQNEDVVLDKLFNPEAGTYHEYRLTPTDLIFVSEDTSDLALLILPKQRILDLIGAEYICMIADTTPMLSDYTVRGFANFNKQTEDRPFELLYVEDQKGDENQFILRSNQQLDTYRQPAVDNLEGLSGCGAWANGKGNTYLTGIVHEYEEGNVFKATKVIAYNYLIPVDKFPQLVSIQPELNEQVLSAFVRMDHKRDEINRRTNEAVGGIHIPRDNI